MGSGFFLGEVTVEVGRPTCHSVDHKLPGGRFSEWAARVTDGDLAGTRKTDWVIDFWGHALDGR